MSRRNAEPTGMREAGHASGRLVDASERLIDAPDRVINSAGQDDAVATSQPRENTASGRVTSACPHCGTAVEGAEDVFCCNGCAHAWEIIHGAGLQDYYRRREALPPRPSGGQGGWRTVPVEKRESGRVACALQIDGLRCAACVWVTEQVLSGIPGVESAHVSYATGRTRLLWDPESTDLPELAASIEALGYRPRVLGDSERWDRGLLLRLGFAGFATMNIMLLSASVYAGWASGMEPRFLALFQWTALILATPLTLWAAGPFFSGAVAGLKRRVLHMDLPIALAITILYGHAFTVTVLASGDGYLDSLGMLITLLLAGRVLESHGRRRTADAALSLAASVPLEARKLEADGSVAFVPTAELVAGDRVAVGAGQEIPADGIVLAGSASVGMALLTGESRPTVVDPGREVYAGTVVQDGSLEIEVRAIGRDTAVQSIADHVRDAVDRPVRPTLADRLAPWFTGLTLAVAAVTLGGWWFARGLEVAIPAAVAVLVVACPCALALAHPLIASAGIGAAARRGLLLRSPEALARLAEVDTVALDKTGTVTGGSIRVVEAADDVLRLAAGLERYSAHPIARAVLEAAVERGIPLPAADHLTETVGVGVSGLLDGRWLSLGADGAERLVLKEWATDPAIHPPHDREYRSRVEGGGGGPQPRVIGHIELEDRARSDSREAIEALRALDLPITILSGDDVDRAVAVGQAVGADEMYGRMSPAAKAEWLEARVARGAHPLFAGDGINDGPALGAAHAGVAMGTGAASSILIADGVIASDSIRPVASGIRIARYTRDAIRRAQRRSVAYNVLAVGAAAAGLVNPLVAAILMPLSSSLVLMSAAGVERHARRTAGSDHMDGGR